VDMWWRCLVHGEAVYQVEQSLIGIGAGGLHGVGFGNGHQRFFLPDQHTDFIFAVLGEETGLLGVLLVLALFLVFAWRGFRIAKRCGDNFGYLLASGLTILIIIYAGVNIGMVSGVLPVMGLPLPFISYGGSALITNMAMVGILLNIDKQGRQPLPGKQTA
jgi:cell division protein FtsW